MKSKNTLSISEARKKIFKIAEEVQKPDNYYTLTEKGRPKVVILSAEEFDSIMETMEILSDPKILANIEKAEEEYKRGEYITWDAMKKEMGFQPKEGLFLFDKGKKKYSAKSKKKK
jgi:prevent-host-death family protein